MAEAVKVIVRCRPLNTRENNLKCKNVIQMDGGIGQCRLMKPGEANQPPKAFTFDGVFNIDSITESIYADIAFPLVEGCVEGYNGTVFAYGQTGCGKSFTMQGIEDPPTQRGIIPRAFEHIFESIQVTDNAKFLVHASYLEIYNEDIRDLLGKDLKNKLEVKEHPDRGIYVKDLLMVPCHNVNDMDKLMDHGGQNRSVGATLMNADSSRSHSIFTIFIETSEAGDDGQEHIRAGKLNLVDLAGSERQAKTGSTGVRLKEATKINLSLSALGNVISALVDEKSTHIPYRDSKLTRLLQDSLGGNTKTLMVACISPADNNYDETLSTLRYANRAKNIKNKPKINEDPKDALLRQYHDEITMLKKLLMGQMDMSPDLIAKLGLTGVAEDKIKPERPPPPERSLSIVERETENIKREYESRLKVMQKKYEDEQLDKQKLAEEVEKLQEDLSNTLKKASTTVDGFNNENAEAILAEFQAKAALNNESELNDESPVSDQLTNNIQTTHEIEAEDNVQKSPAKEAIQKSSRSNSPSLLKGYAAKGLGLIKDKLSGSLQNLSVSVSKQGEVYTEPDIHVSDAVQKKSVGGTVGSVAAHLQEEAVKRLNSLQEQLVGGDSIKDSKVKQDLKRKHKSRKDHARDRQLKMIKEVHKWEGEGIMVKVYDNLQDEIKAKDSQISELENELTAVKIDKSDIESEFQSERNDYLDTIRKLEKDIQLQNKILEKVQPTIRRECNYFNFDKIKSQSEFDEESNSWLVPELQVERTSLPKVLPRKETLSSIKPVASQESIDRGSQEHGDIDKFASHLQNNSNDEFSNNYFKPKRIDKLLAGSNSSINGLSCNNNNSSSLGAGKITTSGRVSPLQMPEPMRRPQKLEALPVSAFEKKKKKNKNKEV